MTPVRIMLSAVAASLIVASAAAAATYNDVTDFSSASSTGVWSYGTGITGTSFTPYTNDNPGCFGPGTNCWQTATPVDLVPAVVANLSGSTINFGTVVLPTNVLLIHPGPSTDSIVRFTVPVTGHYDVSGFYELLDTNPTGVNAIIAANGSIVASFLLTGPGAVHPNTPGEIQTFGATDIFLPAGLNIDYGVNNDGSFLDDSTGMGLTFTLLPEPGAWAMTLLGLAGMGAGLRTARRRRVPAIA
jgi:hypothetical protein